MNYCDNCGSYLKCTLAGICRAAENHNHELTIRFPDQSKSFTYGVEYGRLLEKMQRGDDVVRNHGFPVRVENRELLEMTCKEYGYIPVFGRVWWDEWVEFNGLKKVSTDN